MLFGMSRFPIHLPNCGRGSVRHMTGFATQFQPHGLRPAMRHSVALPAWLQPQRKH
jgi:hypothetical protein